MLRSMIAAVLLTTPAMAQQTPVVQCQVGAWSGTMPSYACDAVTRGARRLRFSGSDVERGRGVAACAQEVKPVMAQVWGDPAYQICQSIFIADLSAGWR
jgi:hypothetical protein